MKYSIYVWLLFIIINKSYAQTPFNQDPGNPNLDLSMGDFTHWKSSWGPRDKPDSIPGPSGVSSPVVVKIYGSNWEGNAGTGNMKRVPDGLQQVARYGDPAGSGLGNSRSYKLKYDLKVNPGYPILFLQIASIMDNTHAHDYNTHYKYSLKTASGDYVPIRPCTGLELYPKSKLDPVALSIPLIDYTLKINPSGNYNYQPWESLAIDLSSYTGQTLSLEFEHYDCSMGVHGSYTYFSAGMRRPIETVYFCKGASEVAISPYLPNFKSYLWNTGATTDKIVVDNPVDDAVYTCEVGSYNSCNATFAYKLKEVITEAAFNHIGDNTCDPVQFFDKSITNVGKIVKWQWDFGDTGSGEANTDTISNPVHHYTAPGSYNVTLTATDSLGCTNTVVAPVEVGEVSIPQFSLSQQYCQDSPQVALPLTSLNGISGIWTPSVINTSVVGTQTCTFTPNEGQCALPFELNVTIHSNPKMELEEKIVICKDKSHTYTAPNGFDSYEWTNKQGQIIGMGKTFVFPEEGIYTLTVKANGVPCQSSKDIKVSFSESPVIVKIQTTENSLTVQATGDYPLEYSLDQVFWQLSPTFTNMKQGIYHVYVRDTKGCTTVSEIAGLLNVPNFISPDGDGHNDSWEIKVLEAYPNTRLQIFDRYGKVLLDKIVENGYRWDGKYDNHSLPSGTYWYILHFENGEKLSGHITVKNR
ncbi:MAG: T9SS type B sorting domain-containing protein [Flavobacteriaceae bacterium]|jgi:gliding motility-associated-like protein|nr:T9SS type B sorting domain-containing protein [Flavobacteriaceae bacterium]